MIRFRHFWEIGREGGVSKLSPFLELRLPPPDPNVKCHSKSMYLITVRFRVLVFISPLIIVPFKLRSKPVKAEKQGLGKWVWKNAVEGKIVLSFCARILKFIKKLQIVEIISFLGVKITLWLYLTFYYGKLFFTFSYTNEKFFKFLLMPQFTMQCGNYLAFWQ